MKVARRYKFRASHSLPGVAGYDENHWHDYTVEVVAEDEDVGRDGMIVDTAAIDAVMEPLVNELDGKDLNRVAPDPTTVENLALWIRGILDVDTGELDVVSQVTVWEDDDRWGEAP